MSRVHLQRPLVAATAVAAVGAAVSLLAPWVRIGATQRSTIDLIGAAGALDVISGAVRIGVVVVWFSVPLLGGAALISLAARRTRLFAAACLVLGLMVAASALLLLVSFGSDVTWGTFLGGGLGGLATVNSVIVLAIAGSKGGVTA